MTATTAAAPAPIVAKKRAGDIWFSGTAVAAGSMIMITLAAVAIFLIVQSIPAFTAGPDDASLLQSNFWEYVGPLLYGTLWAALLALLMAVPLSLGVALFITHYAPRRLAQTIGYIVDLLAAVPSVVFGLWGIFVLAPAVQPAYAWLNANLGWIPFFGGVVSPTGRTILTAAIVLAVMVVPIITAICREIFLQTPRLHEEAALALGATRWEMIRMAVLPFGRSGIVSGSMLGLGRALGETMAVTFVVGNANRLSASILDPGSTIASRIANEFNEALGLQLNALIALGCILFFVTFVVLVIARLLVARVKRY